MNKIQEDIKKALARLGKEELKSASRHLLNTLGYRSDRIADLSGTVDDFININGFHRRDGTDKPTQNEQEFRKHAHAVHVVFQVTDDEVAESQFAGGKSAFDSGLNKSFIFTAVELKSTSYPRSQYAKFTREVNKRLPGPTVVLFRTKAGRLTLAFVYRRRHKKDESRDVLGKASLIREIDLKNPPHRAHLDILAELSLGKRIRWMEKHDKPANFDGLLSAWLDALDTEKLNRRFYRELSGWYERVVQAAKFPTGQAKSISAEEHVIRLITRLLFVWFIKQKGLVEEDLFIESEVEKLLKDYDSDTGDSWYRAILQNLFFATLNTEIGKRGFSTETNATHRNFSRYRYRKEIADENRLLKLFAQTPFINGGLFDCLDSEESTTQGGYRIDCFSDNQSHGKKLLSIPNRLFFGGEGLIPLLDRYKFTVEENTPVEREVALDPELLGKVFENLLAAYNPETKETARKQTGSYYTPRQVVDYMVDEALIEVLADKVRPTDDDGDFLRERLRYLLDYEDAFDDANELFTDVERDAIVRALAEIKVLDPAVGSGAFPMGMLHKLTLALRRLDPSNARWEQLQKKQAGSRHERDAELKAISDGFERYRDSDFGRKLYLIQNSIYGVDIQPIACQIAKLRFFISLAIEQEPTDDKHDNYGIKPLPNLETRFVAANTLLGLCSPQGVLTSEEATHLKREIHDNRERHFHATFRSTKLKLQEQDNKLRSELAKELGQIGMPADDANKVAHWNPYDHNAKAGWFDPDYMFGVRDGFDVVIGNPPYVQLQKNGGELGNLYKDAGYETFAGTGDIYQLFYEQGCRLLKPKSGLLAYITSNSWLKAKYGKKTREYFAEKHSPLRLLEIGKDVFESAIVDVSVLIMRHGKGQADGKGVDMDRLPDKSFPPEERHWGLLRLQGENPWLVLSATEQPILDKMENIGTPLKEWDISINYGIKTGYNDAFIIDTTTKERLVAEDPKSAEILKPILRGRDIRRNCAYHAEFERDKLVWMDLTEEGRFAYDAGQMFCANTAFIMTGQSLKYLCAFLNSRLTTWFMRHTGLNSGMGVTRWIAFTVEAIPIPKVSAEKQQLFIDVVDKILAIKGSNPAADTAKWEKEIDRLVYALYDLTEKEIQCIETY